MADDPVTVRLCPAEAGGWRSAMLKVFLAAVVAAFVLGQAASAQLPSPAGMGVGDAASTRGAAADLPSPRSIFDRHLEAIGGRQAVLSHKSTFARGTFSMPAAGVTGTLEIYAAAPNKSLLKISLAGLGAISEGFDGTYGWSLSPMTGPMLLDGKQLEEKRFDAEFHGDLRSEGRYASLTTLERTEFDGRPCYKVRLVRKTGGEDLEFYDVATGLKAGAITTRETPMGTITGTVIETDYRKFGNLLQPTTLRSQVAGVQQVITITSIDYDSVPASVFDLPAEIKALIK